MDIIRPSLQKYIHILAQNLEIWNFDFDHLPIKFEKIDEAVFNLEQPIFRPPPSPIWKFSWFDLGFS